MSFVFEVQEAFIQRVVSRFSIRGGIFIDKLIG